jgi:hypothetical protein
MKKSLLLLVAVLGSMTAVFGQDDVHQVFFLNEGYYDYFEGTQVVEPTLGVYDMDAGFYTEVATLGTERFGSGLAVYDEKVYVAADTKLMVFDANTYYLLAEIDVVGIRSVAVSQGQIIVTRGDVVPLDSYLQVYDAGTLDLLYEFDAIDGPGYPAQDIIIVGDEAFIGVNNGFTWGAEVGIIGILDLENQSYGNEIDLGEDGTNPDNMMFDGETIYTLNNKDFSGSSISSVDVVSGSLNATTNVALNAGCASSMLAEGQVHFMEYGIEKVARFDVATEEVVDTLDQSQAYYGMAYESISGQIFATTTDYVTTGTAFILDTDHNEISSFEVGVSAGSIAFDIREATDMHSAKAMLVQVFPNPANDFVTITASEANASLFVKDLSGRVVYSSYFPNGSSLRVDLGDWAAGVYILDVNGSKTKLVKR